MSILFYAEIKDEETGALLIQDLECFIEASIEYGNVVIYDIRVKDATGVTRSLYHGTDLSRAIAAQVHEQALADDDFIDAVGVEPWGVVEQQRELGTWF
ncbi:hypothetical protein NO932_06445 [Pelagibacterium sp. 26DY04]|uniref:hypothetical protein n=1 Tax=Pelagibacterium sp. 26DY04 TaxID=2967130 RepID=UPI0028167D08|nr:hypothetical protein [Pelagibacterium sp. 26DY04]WMT88244.1 hypothetical protein NO932_06445 [Pelagibacterium sp. 26DY04]